MLWHRINDVLKTCFYQTAQKKKKRTILASTTPTTKNGKTSKIIIQSSSDYTSSDEETKAPSPSKHIENEILHFQNWRQKQWNYLTL